MVHRRTRGVVFVVDVPEASTSTLIRRLRWRPVTRGRLTVRVEVGSGHGGR